jgi:hypothetical protein
VVVVTEWDTDINGTSFQSEAARSVFSVFSLLFFFQDAEGFAGEIRPNFFVDDSRFPDKGLITTETFFEVLS